ncbi:hypothetical protein V4Z26_003890 [Vibrio alginolyticus]
MFNTPSIAYRQWESIAYLSGSYKGCNALLNNFNSTVTLPNINSVLDVQPKIGRSTERNDKLSQNGLMVMSPLIGPSIELLSIPSAPKSLLFINR